MTKEISTTKKVIGIAAIIAASVTAGVVIDNDPDPVMIDNTERIIIDRSVMTWDEYQAFVSAANSAGQSGDLEFKNIDNDYNLIDAVRARVNK